MNEKLCPCKSNSLYKDCCEKYHSGEKNAKNAKILMRSRFSAYALGLVDYIIKTTHPQNPLFKKDIKDIKNEILSFSKNTIFKDLEILDFEEEENHAFVTFVAFLESIDNENISFMEISHFEKVNGLWLYKDGQFFEGIKEDIF
ncbi:MAG: hypothetical protein JXA94_00535 [Parachlamydiales bacterium]|nr:hypothetical protein [Parachlamydiales bacterium]